jgi:G:T-mismatch repair DNA endonuclease (very short patch repair protein)
MGNKINLDENLVIKEYLSGKSSLVLSVEFGVSKPKILSILKKYNVTKKRDRCETLEYKIIGGYYIIERICPTCKKIVATKSKDKVIACRNYFNKLNEKRDCKTCSLEKQKGEGNPFYGKKHNKNTKNKISKSRKGKAVGDKNAMSNPLYREKVKNKFLERIKTNPAKHKNRSKNEIIIYNKIKKKFKNAKYSFVVKPYICDIFIPDLNLIIEYNGDYWHCNPNKYDQNYYHKIKKKTAKEIWERDNIKIDLIKKNGYTLEVLWEYDYNQNPKIINEIIKKYVKKN